MPRSTVIKLNPIGLAVGCIFACVGLWALGVPQYFFGSHEEVNYDVSLRELLSAGIDVARRGGDVVKKIRLGREEDLNAETKGKTLEGAAELKTEGDMQSHIAMMYALKKGFNGISVVSEEHDNLNPDLSKVEAPNKMRSEITHLTEDLKVPLKDITVWIDPLDATQEYTEDLRQYVTTMMCVAVKGVPIIGVIHMAFDEETYWGFVDHGVSSNLKSVAPNTSAKERIIVSRSHAGTVEEVVKKSMGEATEIIPAGGAGYKTVQVIKGDADAYVHVTRIKKWDICAGNAIINAAGGEMTTMHGGKIDYDKAGDPKNDEGLLATMSNHKKFLDVFEPEYDALQKKH
ncbi:hypothetical protein CAPTEDRAFT_181179 [Capitella teleta]|uniref:inositol-phosphate phosphatase n=1 Tax=Capitella teleta TaxID=283909 RepID=R7UMY3_CAPTE|nr:hypothetical protein CAPTEDRAFT_181179 [Capitella teleta]|eukprot:ELU05302.1 hypothetical protein CAPTEDRAFT_181179 [Capitella teleta]